MCVEDCALNLLCDVTDFLHLPVLIVVGGDHTIIECCGDRQNSKYVTLLHPHTGVQYAPPSLILHWSLVPLFIGMPFSPHSLYKCCYHFCVLRYFIQSQLTSMIARTCHEWSTVSMLLGNVVP